MLVNLCACLAIVIKIRNKILGDGRSGEKEVGNKGTYYSSQKWARCSRKRASFWLKFDKIFLQIVPQSRRVTTKMLAICFWIIAYNLRTFAEFFSAPRGLGLREEPPGVLVDRRAERPAGAHDDLHQHHRLQGDRASCGLPPPVHTIMSVYGALTCRIMHQCHRRGHKMKSFFGKLFRWWIVSFWLEMNAAHKDALRQQCRVQQFSVVLKLSWNAVMSAQLAATNHSSQTLAAVYWEVCYQGIHS